MYSLNGIGTKLYGKKDVETDGSYIATKWFIFFLVPIVPLGSFRVSRGKTTATFLLPGAKTEFRMVRVPADWKQILKTYLVWSPALAIIVWIIVVNLFF